MRIGIYLGPICFFKSIFIFLIENNVLILVLKAENIF